MGEIGWLGRRLAEVGGPGKMGREVVEVGCPGEVGRRGEGVCSHSWRGARPGRQFFVGASFWGEGKGGREREGGVGWGIRKNCKI